MGLSFTTTALNAALLHECTHADLEVLGRWAYSCPLPISPLLADTNRDAGPQARRGKSMSRRSGQNPKPQKEGNWYVVRFWMDVEGQEKRKRMYERICPVSGPDKLSASERERKAKEIIAASGADTVEHFEKVVQSIHGTTFREQAKKWLKEKGEGQDPVAPSTLSTWKSALENWLYPEIGDTPLDSIKILTLKNLRIKMVEGKLGASAVRGYTNIVKMVMASAVDEEGDALYPRQWNHKFNGVPRSKKINRPSFAGEAVTGIMANTEGSARMLFALLASAGLRLGETLGIYIKNISPDCSTIKIVTKAWRGEVHEYLKTANGEREVDLHPDAAAMLKEFIGDRTSGLLFRSRSGKPLYRSNILRRWLHPVLAELELTKCGAHSFRRFRLSHIRKYGCPKDLEHFWMGHEDEEIGDIYSKLKYDVPYRQEWAEKLGLGFTIPSKIVSIGRNGRKIEDEAVSEVAVSA